MTWRPSSLVAQPWPLGLAAADRNDSRSMLSHHAPKSRRGTHAGRALLALLVAASVLVLGHDPAQGAATYAESRRLEGLTRYQTAIDIAETYIDEVTTLEIGTSVDTVILTSGSDEHSAYALPVPALSRLHNAPLLLTRPERLHSSVAAFLAANDISTVIILGDDSVVSNSVERAIVDIGDVEVTRIAGDDPYDTAAAVADQIGLEGVPGEFPNEGRTAFLATGEAFADALAAGPIAYRGSHPILLTRSAVLPESSELFFEASGTEHVVILGGPAAVSTTVEREISDLGIEITRWGGADRFDTAVRIAEALLGVDTPDECFDGAELGLAYGRRSPDAIVSGPLLGELCAPLLLTEFDELPPSVEQLLQSDDYVTGDINGDVRFNVFGGAGAVAEAAVDAATSAAQLPGLRGHLSAVAGGCHFTVEFSEPVVTADAANSSNYFTGNAGFAVVDAGSGPTTTRATVTFGGATVGPGSNVPTDCISPLQARDRVGIADRAIKSASDGRTVVGEELVILPDNSRPTLLISAPQGSSIVWVESTEPLLAAAIAVLFERNSVPDFTVEVTLDNGATMLSIDVPSALGGELRAGDEVSIASRQVTDLAGNENRASRREVVNDETPPQVDRITVTELAATQQASVTLSSADAGGQGDDAILISANAGASVDGAAGNEWQIDVNVRSVRPRSWSSSQLSAVRVSESSQRILVQVLAEATVTELADDLNADRAFRTRFSALSFDRAGSSSPADTRGRVSFEGGASTVDLRVRWTEPVHGCTTSHRAVEPRNIEIDADGDGEADFALDGHAFGDSDVMLVAADGQGFLPISDGSICDTTPGVRSGTLVARIESSDVNNLPDSQSQATIRPGAASDFARNFNVTQTGVMLRRP